jgi:acyl-CoA thioesterase-1
VLNRLLMAGVILIACAAPAGAERAEEPVGCLAPSQQARLSGELPRTAARLASGERLKIVALGSSSTAGAGASAKRHDYPSRLAAELLRRYPGNEIEVVNRGVNGEEAEQMLARLQRDVIDERPDLVVWQVGTNALLRGTPIEKVESAVEQGIERLRADNIDVVVMDLQYAPRVNGMPLLNTMNERLEAVARKFGAPVFHRFAIMRDWAHSMGEKYAALVHPDGLHMNDASYGCLAAQLASALAGRQTTEKLARP